MTRTEPFGSLRLQGQRPEHTVQRGTGSNSSAHLARAARAIPAGTLGDLLSPIRASRASGACSSSSHSCRVWRVSLCCQCTCNAPQTSCLRWRWHQGSKAWALWPWEGSTSPLGKARSRPRGTAPPRTRTRCCPLSQMWFGCCHRASTPPCLTRPALCTCLRGTAGNPRRAGLACSAHPADHHSQLRFGYITRKAFTWQRHAPTDVAPRMAVEVFLPGHGTQAPSPVIALYEP